MQCGERERERKQPWLLRCNLERESCVFPVFLLSLLEFCLSSVSQPASACAPPPPLNKTATGSSHVKSTVYFKLPILDLERDEEEVVNENSKNRLEIDLPRDSLRRGGYIFIRKEEYFTCTA